MTAIDQLLFHALLLKEPDVPADTVPYEDSAYPAFGPDCAAQRHDLGESPGEDTVALDLQALCETVVSRNTETALEDFITEQLPAPRAAWVLGCILQLADAKDGARFWWQYAAGAGDDAASYCLYLHHLSLGETHAAAWWSNQTGIDTRLTPETVALPDACEPADRARFDASTPTVLRVLSRLAASDHRWRTDVVAAVMEYVPAVVAAGYADHPDLEIPLPGPYFAEHIGIILATTSPTPVDPRRALRPRAHTELLPNRAGHTHSRADQSRDAVRGGHR